MAAARPARSPANVPSADDIAAAGGVAPPAATMPLPMPVQVDAPSSLPVAPAAAVAPLAQTEPPPAQHVDPDDRPLPGEPGFVLDGPPLPPPSEHAPIDGLPPGRPAASQWSATPRPAALGVDQETGDQRAVEDHLARTRCVQISAEMSAAPTLSALRAVCENNAGFLDKLPHDLNERLHAHFTELRDKLASGAPPPVPVRPAHADEPAFMVESHCMWFPETGRPGEQLRAGWKLQPLAHDLEKMRIQRVPLVPYSDKVARALRESENV